MVLADNAFGWGLIASREVPPEEASSVLALREFSLRLTGGGRFRSTMIPTEEGLAVGVKIR